MLMTMGGTPCLVEAHINLDSIAEWALDSVTGGSRLLPANNIMAGARFYRGLAARLAAGEARCGGAMENGAAAPHVCLRSCRRSAPIQLQVTVVWARRPLHSC
jgi:hypothetical protein